MSYTYGGVPALTGGTPLCRSAVIPTWMELVSACPMCSAPVTLGGGMTMTKGGLVEVGSGLKKPHCSHHSYLQPRAVQTRAVT